MSTTEQSIKQLLDEERAQLVDDTELLAQLALARQAALQAASIESKKIHWWQAWHVPSSGNTWGGAIAACFALVVFVYVVSLPEPQMLDPEWLGMDVEVAMSLDDFEEDVEFYYWMEDGNS